MLLNLRGSKLDKKIVLLIVPLLLVSFTHLWNISGFPSFHPDEGVYIRRALHILNGQGVQDPSSKFDHSQESTSSYDHPYFGPILLAGIFKLVGYPQSLNTTVNVDSIERVSAEPRIIMGIMAIVDTFLVYRISERRYNSKVAFFASVIFAVMPLSWFSRRVVLDSIMLPFLLTSMLLILEIKFNPKQIQILSLLSGVCLGLAVFTKIPAFTFIPIVLYLIHQSTKNEEIIRTNKIKVYSLWLIPVILIPIIWPAYALVSGDFQEWMDGVIWQSSERKSEGKSFYEIINSALKTDPLILIGGTAGIVYLTVRRDLFAIIWTLPYVIFLILVGWVTHFHLIPIIPVLSISIAGLIQDIPLIAHIKKSIPASAMIFSVIAVFGLISTLILISTDLTDAQFASVSYIAGQLVHSANNPIISNNSTEYSKAPLIDDDKDNITVISSPIFSWVYKYVFDADHIFTHVRDTQPIKTDKIILLVDSTYRHVISGVEGENSTQIYRLNNLYNNTDVVALFKDDSSKLNRKTYPFTGLDSASIGSVTQEIRSN